MPAKKHETGGFADEAYLPQFGEVYLYGYDGGSLDHALFEMRRRLKEVRICLDYIEGSLDKQREFSGRHVLALRRLRRVKRGAMKLVLFAHDFERLGGAKVLEKLRASHAKAYIDKSDCRDCKSYADLVLETFVSVIALLRPTANTRPRRRWSLLALQRIAATLDGWDHRRITKKLDAEFRDAEVSWRRR